jgi:ABC-type lipoprotein export system ATPase subunit
MNNIFIECNSVSKQYKGNNHIINAITDVSLQLRRGEFVLLKGRSGAGKSTLLNLIGGLTGPTSGTIKIGDQIINQLDNKSLSSLLLNKIGIIFQSLNLLPTYSIYENVEIALAPKGLLKNEIRELILPVLDQFKLMDKINSLPDELSVGQQQKAAIVRTLVKQPSVILADEPTASVDEETGNEIIEHLKDLCRKSKATVILATHGIVTNSIADSVIKLEDGRIINDH